MLSIAILLSNNLYYSIKIYFVKINFIKLYVNLICMFTFII